MDAYNLNSQPEILYRTNPDYKNCVVGIDLWYPEKDARDVPVQKLELLITHYLGGL